MHNYCQTSCITTFSTFSPQSSVETYNSPTIGVAELTFESSTLKKNVEALKTICLSYWNNSRPLLQIPPTIIFPFIAAIVPRIGLAHAQVVL
ncbi:hypothetical protein EUGRSUZ_H00612 [Eucalyptus grandis]|uniref:Uncharacterized protein n=2 Tax=Eucalyptus grandis TaxID=71139 RepID=A0ACC3JM23_EUCGR|nr:hypothetical protein EUGRSUZ_H00612 [Eucalyptus grandis]